MSTTCYILGVGRYRPSVKHCLEYPSDFYAEATPKNTVMATLFHCDSHDKSVQLCEAFGLQARDVEKHWLGRISDPPIKELERIEWPKGRSMQPHTDWDSDVESLKLLIAAEFFFMIRASF